MKTKILKILVVSICCLFLCCCQTKSVVSYPNPTDKFFVNDYADVLSDATEQKVFEQGNALYEKTDAQVAVLIVESLNGEDIERYSMEIAEKWKLGDQEKDNGILLLIAVKEREIRIEVGYGLEGAIPDIKADYLMEEHAYPPLKSNDYDTAVTNLYNALTNEIYIEYGLEPDSNYTPASELEDSQGSLILHIIVLIIVVTLVFGRRGRGGFVFLPFLGHGSHHHGGGGFGGGGGFRGGGGGFGGGGASGRF